MMRSVEKSCRIGGADRIDRCDLGEGFRSLEGLVAPHPALRAHLSPLERGDRADADLTGGDGSD
jgi:hypothetical protein